MKAISRGVVLQRGVQTSPGVIPYWNTTYFVLVRIHRGLYLRYAELDTAFARPGDHIRAGEIIGTVGEVIDRAAVTEADPAYIRELCDNGRVSMLHLEVCRRLPNKTSSYLGGNWLAGGEPSWFADPAPLLRRAGLRPRVRTQAIQKDNTLYKARRECKAYAESKTCRLPDRLRNPNPHGPHPVHGLHR